MPNHMLVVHSSIIRSLSHLPILDTATSSVVYLLQSGQVYSKLILDSELTGCCICIHRTLL